MPSIDNIDSFLSAGSEPPRPRLPTPGFAQRKHSFAGVVDAMCWSLVALSPLVFFGRLHWLLELTSHFRPHIAIGLAAAAAWGVHRSAWWLTSLGAIAVVLVGLPVLLQTAPLHQPTPRNGLGLRTPTAPHGQALTMLQFNVKTENIERARALAWLQTQDADLLALQEVDTAWLQALAPLHTRYRYRFEHPRGDNFGIALWSRLPLVATEVVDWGATGLPSLRATVMVGDGDAALPVQVVVAHPEPPTASIAAQGRDAMLHAMAASIGAAQGRQILIGDLNVTPWSPLFGDILGLGALHDAGLHHGLQGSWPAWLPIGRIAIDHCLVSDGIEVLDRVVGPDVGSDHRPVRTSLAVLPQG